MSKKAGNIMGNKEDSDEQLLPEPPPGRVISAHATAGGGTPPSRGTAGPHAGFFARISQFLHDVRAEMKRVSWPTAANVKNTTIITLAAVIFFAIYLFAVDQGLTFLITQLERLVNSLFGAA